MRIVIGGNIPLHGMKAVTPPALLVAAVPDAIADPERTAGARVGWAGRLSDRDRDRDELVNSLAARWQLSDCSRPARSLRSGEPSKPADLSSLHCAVSFHGCNIHVDETGFVIADELGSIVNDPDLVQHIFNELVFKTYGKYLLPEGIGNRVNLVLPNTANDFNRIGVSRVGRRVLQRDWRGESGDSAENLPLTSSAPP